MLNYKSVAVVVPAFNEKKQISEVILTMPDFVDKIVIVDDASIDGTDKIALGVCNEIESLCYKKANQRIEIVKKKYNEAEIIAEKIRRMEDGKYVKSEVLYDIENKKVVFIRHYRNSGVGAAISTGYKWCRENLIDCAAVMAGDGQMDPDELISICSPVVNDGIDYVKGNRLIHRSAPLIIPKIRYFGNSVLSLMTKVASGYWHITDTQTGFTAISLKALNAIDLHKIYKSYGMPNDMLVKLNIALCTIKEIEIKPIYRIGETSKMKILKVIPMVSLLLFKSFFIRLWKKYLFRDFHPLFLLYNFSFLLLLFCIPFFISIVKNVIIKWGSVSVGIYLAFILFFTSGFQSLLFAMWMDIQDNERLYK